MLTRYFGDPNYCMNKLCNLIYKQFFLNDILKKNSIKDMK